MASQLVRPHAGDVSRRSLRAITILLYLLPAAAAADLLTLFRNIPVLGLAAEANPVALFVLVNFGPWGLVGAKAASVMFASAVALILVRSGRARLARATLSICFIATVLAALTNVWSL